SFSFFTPASPALHPSLFPYTTLFRSLPSDYPRGVPFGAGSVHQQTRNQDCAGAVGSSGAAHRRLRGVTVFLRSSTIALPTFANVDRKSTRLNSSHLGISYAVFCLKKK